MLNALKRYEMKLYKIWLNYEKILEIYSIDLEEIKKYIIDICNIEYELINWIETLEIIQGGLFSIYDEEYNVYRIVNTKMKISKEIVRAYKFIYKE